MRTGHHSHEHEELMVYAASGSLQGVRSKAALQSVAVGWRLVWVLLVAVAIGIGKASAQVDAGPYVPTPQYIVNRMLQMADVGPKDYVIDLGSGDGRIVITAAKTFGARGLGVDINERLVDLAILYARKEGVYERARFETRDVFKTDISAASVLTLYLLPKIVLDLRPKILTELRPGTRIVTHDYHFGDWNADNQITFDSPEKEGINGMTHTSLYYYIVPARVAGTWRLKLPAELGETAVELSFQQAFQQIEGSVESGGRSVSLRYASLRGDRISFAMPVGGVTPEFTAQVKGDQIVGTVAIAGKGKLSFTAARVAAGKAKGWE